MNTNTTTPTVIGRCTGGHVVLGTWDDVIAGWLGCPCGLPAIARAFKARTTNRTCGAQCRNAMGPSCSCECGGRNHGADLWA